MRPTHTHRCMCVKKKNLLMGFCFCCEITHKMFIELQLVPSMYNARASRINFIYDFQLTSCYISSYPQTLFGL
jgi:hypothetical protein